MKSGLKESDAKTVLVIDDDAEVRETLPPVLEEAGYIAGVFRDADEGLERALIERPDFVLYDLRMPGRDGLEFIERYSAAGGTARVIILYAYGSNEAALGAMRAGAYDVLPKPVDAEELLLTLRKAALRERHEPDRGDGSDAVEAEP